MLGVLADGSYWAGSLLVHAKIATAAKDAKESGAYDETLGDDLVQELLLLFFTAFAISAFFA